MARRHGRDPAAGTSANPPDVLVRDVSGSPAEFDASLRQAASGSVDGAWPTYRVVDGPVRLEIEASPGQERRIAAIRLPTLRVTYRFIGGSHADRQALLARLDRAMHRGGG